MQGKKWLVVSPHADDAELGCGGLMARARAEGIEVHVVVVSIRGVHQGHAKAFVPWTVRERELSAALAVIGATYEAVFIGDEHDLGTMPKGKLVSRLDRVIDAYQPDTVFLPVPSFHQEHQYVFECAVAACRPTRHPTPIRNVYAYEYPPAGWGPSASWDPSRGGTYFDVSEHIETKIKMLEAHKSQMYRGKDALISFEAVRALARYRGIEAGVAHAELLYLMRGTV